MSLSFPFLRPARNHRLRRRLAVLSSVVALSAALVAGSLSALPAQAASFIGLGFLSSDFPYSEAYGVSADGNVVFGLSYNGSADEAFRWTQADGMSGLGFLTPGDPNNHSVAYGASADGSVIVGESHASDGGGGGLLGDQAFRWTQATGMQGLGYLAVGEAHYSVANGVSGDGGIVVGFASVPTEPPGDPLYPHEEAFRWTQADGMISLGDLTGGDVYSGAYAISDNGNVIVGFGTSDLGYEAFRWEKGSMIGLGDLVAEADLAPGALYDSAAYGVNADGSVIVGYGANASGNAEAFRWEAGNMIGLGGAFDEFGNGFVLSEAYGVSADGSVIVGNGLYQYFDEATGNYLFNSEAFLWTESLGMVRLKNHLVDNYGLGSALEGWDMEGMGGISADGLTISGYGTNPDGNIEAWQVSLASTDVPEPGALALMLLGVTGAVILRRRR